MSFQAYIDNIKAKTGKTPEDFKKLAEKKDLLGPDVKAGEIIKWLKEDFDLGHGHAMAIYAILSTKKGSKTSKEDAISNHFGGKKQVWKDAFNDLINKLSKFGDDITTAPTNSYISLLKKGKKFAIVQITADRVDIGIKLKKTEPTGRFEPAGAWNAMVTHRVQITNQKQIDNELLSWLKKAYEAA